VWPDTGRLARTRAAITDAQQHPPIIRRGDMVADVYRVLDELPRNATLCVLTTWAVAYLSRETRVDFAAELARMGRERPVVWISGEGPNVVPAFADLGVPTRDIEASILGAILYDGETVRTTPLAFVHPHGSWIDWIAP
jgi:hypothetical protein